MIYDWTFIAFPLLDYFLFGKRNECKGARAYEEKFEKKINVDACADACRNSSKPGFFMYGNDDYNPALSDKCDDRGCPCFCLIECTVKSAAKYDLYKFKGRTYDYHNSIIV